MQRKPCAVFFGPPCTISSYYHRRRRGIKCGYAESEAQRAESGEGFLNRGSESPPYQLAGSGPKFKFGAFWDMKIASKMELNVPIKVYERPPTVLLS